MRSEQGEGKLQEVGAQDGQEKAHSPPFCHTEEGLRQKMGGCLRNMREG